MCYTWRCRSRSLTVFIGNSLLLVFSRQARISKPSHQISVVVFEWVGIRPTAVHFSSYCSTKQQNSHYKLCANNCICQISFIIGSFINYATMVLFDPWPWPLTFWSDINWWARYRDGLSCAKVWWLYSCTFSRFGFIMQTNTQTLESHTAVANLYTTVGVDYRRRV